MTMRTNERTGNRSKQFTGGIALIVLALALLNTGCSSMGKSMKTGFLGGESENLVPFAEETIARLGGGSYPLAQETAILIREFFDPPFDEITRLDQYLVNVDAITTSVMTYSVDLVTISEMNISARQKAERLADSFGPLREPAQTHLDISDEDFEAILDEVRNADDFLASLRAIQPLIDATAVYFGFLMSDIEKTLNGATIVIDGRIEQEFKSLTEFLQTMEERKQKALIGLKLIHDHRSGDGQALAQLRGGNIILDESLASADADELESYLVERITLMKELLDTIEPDIALYRATHLELDEQHQRVLTNVGVARLNFLTWARAHRMMASGVKDPAKWFDVRELPETLVGAAIKAI
jgi:hypothetical protein